MIGPFYGWNKFIQSKLNLIEHLAICLNALQITSLASSSCISYSKRAQGEEYGCLLCSSYERITSSLGWNPN